jgi:NADPH:quinone reductase-like Zn-dependent oxidoreductase
MAQEDVIKAIVQDRYGSPDVLRLKDIDKPVPEDNEVLVRVRAAAVNIGNWHVLRGIPYAMRPAVGLFKPKHEIPGLDLAGQVEAVGGSVKQFQPGDEVFGWCNGAFAEYACAEENNLLAKPSNLTLEQAAAIGDSAFTALNAVRDQGEVQPGQRVVINGASGGVGTFAIQIAKSFGADVTLSDCMGTLSRQGTYVLVGVSDMDRWFGLARQIKALSLSPFVRQSVRVFIVKHNRADLAVLKELVEAGKVTPVIDRRYPLREVPEALRYQGEGHARGKIIITV